MRSSFSKFVEAGRVQLPGAPTRSGDRYGAFILLCPITRQPIKVIVAPSVSEEVYRSYGLHGEPFEHVSASLRDRCPRWDEMCWVKNLFFEPHEAVMQLHVPKADHINCHPYTLHLWRPTKTPIPRPDPATVGPKKIEPVEDKQC